jgi:predicted Zn-dependent protease with MMP-like domain
MSDEEFEKLVEKGIGNVPKEFRNKLNNVAITFADEPTHEQLAKNNVPAGSTLFGLYEGIPQTARGGNYSLVVPDRITIFKLPILRASYGNPHITQQLVSETVWHEVGHHFGLSEEQIRSLDEKRHNSTT